MAHDVFISHSTSDKAIASAVCATLENGHIRCWVAPRDVQPGRSFAGEITRAIQRSKAMVLIFSASSNKSEQVLREVQLAVESHLHILQFRIEDVQLTDDLRYYLSTPHWLDALTPPLESHLERLKTSMQVLLDIGREESAKPLAAKSTRNIKYAPESRPLLRTMFWVGGGLVVAVSVLTFVFIIQRWKPAERQRAPEKASMAAKNNTEETSADPAGVSDPADLIGSWNWVPKDQIVTIKEGGTATSNYRVTATWKQVGSNTYILRWSNGYIDTLHLSQDGKTLIAVNQHGGSPNAYAKRPADGP
jgi:hypothetical protein